MIVPDWIGYLVVAWSICTFSLYIYLLTGIRKRQLSMAQDLWNQKVELQDMDGTIIKIPVTKVIKDKDGNEIEQVTNEVGPLWLTVAYGLGTFAANQVKMSILSAKGKISRQLNTAALVGDADMNPATLAAIELLPRKYQGIALMLSKYLGRGGQPGGGAELSSKPGNREI